MTPLMSISIFFCFLRLGFSTDHDYLQLLCQWLSSLMDLILTVYSCSLLAPLCLNGDRFSPSIDLLLTVSSRKILRFFLYRPISSSSTEFRDLSKAIYLFFSSWSSFSLIHFAPCQYPPCLKERDTKDFFLLESALTILKGLVGLMSILLQIKETP